jgi:hypothetical protein
VAFRSIYRLAGTAALVALAATILDVVLGLGHADQTRGGARTAVEWFAIFEDNRFRGLYLLGVLNIVYMATMTPVYIGLFAVQRHTNGIYAALAASIAFVGMAIYIANNAAMPMFVLADKYAAATSDAQRAVVAAAGEAALARGEDFTPGAFPGLILNGLGAALVSFAMFRGEVFSRATAWVGIVGFTCLCLFTVWATFVPAFYGVAFYLFGTIGGVLALAWFAQVSRRFFQLA